MLSFTSLDWTCCNFPYCQNDIGACYVSGIILLSTWWLPFVLYVLVTSRCIHIHTSSHHWASRLDRWLAEIPITLTHTHTRGWAPLHVNCSQSISLLTPSLHSSSHETRPSTSAANISGSVCTQIRFICENLLNCFSYEW